MGAVGGQGKGGGGWGQLGVRGRWEAVRGGRDGAPPRAPLDALAESASDEDHLPADERELLVRERERPQSEVRGRVRDAAEDKLDRVDDLIPREREK